MNITYHCGISTGFYDNFDILKDNQLFEKTHKNSYFKRLFSINKKYLKNQNLSTVIAYFENKPIGFCLFLHYNELTEQKFVFQKESITFSTLGNIMFYVLPEYRHNSIASNMAKLMEENLFSFINQTLPPFNKYFVINSVDDAFPVVNKSFKLFFPSFTNKNSSKNKQDLIEHIRYYKKYKPLVAI